MSGVYYALSAGEGLSVAAPSSSSPSRVSRSVPTIAGLAILALLLRPALFSADRAASTSAGPAFQPQRGVDKAVFRPGLPVPLPSPTTSAGRRPCLFLPSPARAALAALGGDEQEAWLYGSQQSVAAWPFALNATEDAEDVCRGVLLCWADGSRLPEAEEILGVTGSTVQRGLASVVLRDGSMQSAYVYYLTQQRFALRRAVIEDRWTIRKLVLSAMLDPTQIKWNQFWLVELPDVGVVACGQLREFDGAQELSSLVVSKPYRGRGLGKAIAEQLIRTASQPLYLECLGKQLEEFYAQLGFVPVTLAELPPAMQIAYTQQYTIE
eukprot:g56663.t1